MERRDDFEEELDFFEDLQFSGLLDEQMRIKPLQEDPPRRSAGKLSTAEALFWVLLALIVTGLLFYHYDGPGAGVLELIVWMSLTLLFGWLRHRM